MAIHNLVQLNVEFTSKCDKTHLCQMCGRQNQFLNPIRYEDMDFDLMQRISEQLPDNIILQAHRDGEPTAYPRLGDALRLFRRQIVSIVTHGLNLVKKADDIIGNCNTITVSAFHNDLDRAAQLKILKEFIQIKGDSAPILNVKIVGPMSEDEERPYKDLGVMIIKRIMHVPEGDLRYVRRDPTIPEIGICLDFLHHPSIDWQGNVYVCNRLDGEDQGLLGNLNEQSLEEIWNSPKRMEWLEAHRAGRRDLASPLCKTCKYWGVPTG